MSAKYESLKSKWQMGYITDDALKGWVKLNEVKPGTGITAGEYESITGKAYDGESSFNPSPAPSESAVWDEMDAAYQQGVDSV